VVGVDIEVSEMMVQVLMNVDVSRYKVVDSDDKMISRVTVNVGMVQAWVQ
jgi:hypothetical protein